MEIKTEEITEKELRSILEFYFGKLYIYNYCYKNSLEFKNFIDNRRTAVAVDFNNVLESKRVGCTKINCDTLVD